MSVAVNVRHVDGKNGRDLRLQREFHRLEMVAGQLRARYGVTVLPVEVDITDRAALPVAFARIEAELGPAWTLVNNAGLAPTGRAEKQWPDDWDRTVALNMTALFQCSLEAAAQMKEAGREE